MKPYLPHRPYLPYVAGAGEFVRVVGYAESTTSLWFDPSGVWLEIQ